MNTVSSGQIVEFGSHLINKASWIEPPQVVTWLPQTAAWKWLAAALLIALIAYGAAKYHAYLNRGYLRQAWQQFQALNKQQDIAGIAKLMRQLAHQHWPGEGLGLMSVTQFSQTLNHLNDSPKIAPEHLSELFAVCYQKEPVLSIEAHQAIGDWFKELTC